ncbi:hypothetical protein AB9K34_12440 [Sedimentitalea sp. XS_ASV28]|uniref:hypothetical protein n=1 Tax=Sedimentitalea sp. XS_ASV28 TaxID=3241296 RepID=UPI0035158038
MLYRFKFLVVLALLCALGGAGLAHRLPGSVHDPALSAFVQAGGSLADLCAQDDGLPQDAVNGCEFCRLVDSVVLDAYQARVVSDLGGQSVLQVPDHQDHDNAVRLDQSRPVRGPPAI